MSYLYNDFLTQLPIQEGDAVYLRAHMQSPHADLPLLNLSTFAYMVETLTPLIPAVYDDNGSFIIEHDHPMFQELVDLQYIGADSILHNERISATKDFYLLVSHRSTIDSLYPSLINQPVPQGIFSRKTFATELTLKIASMKEQLEEHRNEVFVIGIWNHSPSFNDLTISRTDDITPIRFGVTMNCEYANKVVKPFAIQPATTIKLQYAIIEKLESNPVFARFMLLHVMLDCFVLESHISLFPISGLGSQSKYLDYHQMRVHMIQQQLDAQYQKEKEYNDY